MAGVNDKAKGAGPSGRGGTGFSFDEKDGRGKGRGRDGDRKDKRGGGGAAYRVINELSALEKALTKSDYPAQKQSLDEIVKGLKPLHLKSLNDLDLGSRGKLLTSLMRVARQPKKDGVPPPPQDSASSGEGVAAAAAGDAAAPVAGEGAAQGAAGEAPAAGAEASAGTVAVSAPAAAPATWNDVIFTVGLVWKVANEADRATAAFEASGRQPSEADLAALVSVEKAPERVERPARPNDRRDGPGSGRGPGGKGRPPGRDRPERGGERRDRPPAREVIKERFERPAAPLVSTGDWALDARKYEEAGRTRDAGRVHETNKSYVEASRLYEIGGDFKSALRAAARGRDVARINALSPRMAPDDVTVQLERAEAWELLMERYVVAQDFGNVARLYERSQQFDQAALAWERAGKLSVARRCYERAKDFVAANRVRDLEVSKLVERGDRLGAATLLMGIGRRPEAIELLKQLPGPKAFAFMQKLKLGDEAQTFAAESLAKAEAENNLQGKARWLEVLGKVEQAAETYLLANRKDKAVVLFEKLGQLPKAAALAESIGQLDRAQALFTRAGDLGNAERVKGLPRPEPRPEDLAHAAALARADAAEDAEAVMPPPPEPAGPVTPTASA